MKRGLFPSSGKLFDVLDGLRDRDLLDRLESCEVDEERVQLKLAPRPKPYEKPDTTKIERLRDEDDPDGLKYASS